jgi:diguanylate cyclase (GGDEF)-like protein
VDPDLLRQLDDPAKEEIQAITSVNTVNGKVWHDITARRCNDAVSGEAAWLISEVDISKLKATEEHAQFLAEHDTLTKLPNRNFVSIYFQQKIDKTLTEGKSGGLIFIDLDNFKNVNDSLGHAAGDQLLVEVAERLRSLEKSQYSIARLGGDEFLLLINPFESEQHFESIMQKIISVVSVPITLQGREVQVTPSIGVALFPNNGTQILELMRHADLAMYHAKETGKNDFAYFSKELSDAAESKMNLVSELRSALKDDQFETYFQPRVEVSSNSIVGAEALVRWNHPTKGQVQPDGFITACEESGLISELGKVVFKDAVIAQRTWAAQGHDIRISVNLSPLQFNEEHLVDELLEIVKEQHGNPNKIELEITESVLLGHDQCTIDKLHQLVASGFEIAIDDFGTGYSNLAYLHRYPISCLKIDRSFVNSMDSAKPIIELIVSMAKLFDLYVVAEGVETPEQLEMLHNFYCQEYQGYLFHKPTDFTSFTTLLSQHGIKVAA